MNLIILGSQGSGKGTQAELLSEKYKLEHIDMGKTLREVALLDTPFGKEVYEIINIKKELVSNRIINKLLELKLSSLNREQGVVIDGIPRNLEQAKYTEELLQESGRKLDKVFLIYISEKESVKRISKRWVCKKCKTILIMGKDIKDSRDKCPACGSGIEQREDDTKEGVKKRLEIFKKETMPVADYFSKKNLLAEINGSQPVEKVFEEITKHII